MCKSKSKWMGVVLALVMVLVFTTPIFAQDGGDPPDTPGEVEEPSKFLDNPIVKLIAEFFAYLFNEEEPKPEVGGGELNGEDPPPPPPPPPPPGDGSPPGDVSTVVETGIDPVKAVAALHEEENLGYGEIVKLMGIVEAICAESGENCGVTLDMLLTEREDGAGIGELFEKYGKPEHLGVGQIRKELEPVGQIKNVNAYRMKKEKTNNGKAKGKNK